MNEKIILGWRATFNPTVVRLGSRPSAWGGAGGGIFQSHCGAIGTGGEYERQNHSGVAFNPTVVRLGRSRAAPSRGRA